MQLGGSREADTLAELRDLLGAALARLGKSSP